MIEIKDKKALLLGLGLHGGGVATAKWLVKHGADLIVSDLKTNQQLAPSLAKLRPLVRRPSPRPLSLGMLGAGSSKERGLSNIRFVLGEHREQDIKWADIIVYNPGVPKESPYLELGRKLGKLIVNEATLFFDRCPGMIIGVTGTRGKSTTTALIGAMLKTGGQRPPLPPLPRGGLTRRQRVIVAGNIRDTAMLDVADKIKAGDIVVLELSSWQLEGLGAVKKSPHIAVVANLYPDHLNRYKRLADYYNSKKEIWRYQNKDDFLVLNGRDKVLRSWAKQAKSRVVFFDKSIVIPNPRSLLSPEALAKGDGEGGEGSRLSAIGRFLTRSPQATGIRNDKRKSLTIWGQHNLENAAAAATVARLLGVKDSVIKKVLVKPPILTGRLEVIAQTGGVTFINDTCATSPEAGLAALKRFGSDKKNIILIAGGADKKLDYDEWAAAARKYCREIYLLTGEASDKMGKALAGFKHAHSGYNNLRAVLKEARAMSRPGDIILFSPSAASFNLWAHEFERGEDFVKTIEKTFDN